MSFRFWGVEGFEGINWRILGLDGMRMMETGWA